MAQVFGDVVESYTMKESVADGITVNLVYEGRAAKVILDQKKVRELCAKMKAQAKSRLPQVKRPLQILMQLSVMMM